ncbi:MAG: tetratricopeptide repeat protein [Bryobacteraceae bacterium]|jgi:Flp pilus assembly protein TadD
MPKCLKCETERRAREPRCEKCGFPFSHYSAGQVIKPGEYELADANAWGECELVWKAQWRRPNSDGAVEIRELAPLPADVARVREACRDWTQACHNSGAAIPKLLDFFTEKQHFCAVWSSEPSPSLRDLAGGGQPSAPDLETLWKAALNSLQTLQAAAGDFCHGDLSPDTICVLPGNSACVRFAAPSLLAYAESRSGQPVRARDLQLLGTALRNTVDSRPGSEIERWRSGPSQAGLEWCCGDQCEPATSTANVLALMEEVARALDREQRGFPDLAREGYAKAAAMARVPFVEECLRRCQNAPESVAPTPAAVIPSEEQKAPPPVATPVPPPRAKTSQKMAVLPREPDKAAQETLVPVVEQAEVPPPLAAVSGNATHEIEIVAQAPEATLVGPATRTPAYSTPILTPVQPLRGPAKTDPGAAADTSHRMPAEAPAKTQPKSPPATKSGQIVAAKASPKMRAAMPGRRGWIVAAGGLAIVAIAGAVWLLPSNSRLNQALSLIQANQLVSTDKTKPSAYSLYRQAVEQDGPKSRTVRAIADAAKPKLDERIQRALTVHYADSNSKDVNWAETSLIAQWRRELSQDNEPKIVAEALFCQGMQDLESGQLSDAIQAFDGSQEAAPTWAGPKNGKARAFFRQGRRNDAEAAYQEAAQLDPKWPEPHLSLGNLYMDTDLDKAEKEFQEALAIRPDLPVANYDLGVLYHTKGAQFFPRSCQALRNATATANPLGLDAHMVGFAKDLMQIVCR